MFFLEFRIINSTLIALMPFSGYVWLAYISSFVIISVTLRLIEFIQFRIDVRVFINRDGL